MRSDSKIFVAGHNGLVGSAIVRKLKENGFSNIITASKQECDLTVQQQTEDLFFRHKFDYVFLAAAKVGGILSNKNYPANFIRDNLLIETNVIDYSYRFKVKKLLFLGSSCIYPKHARQPITEDQLLTGLLEPTNEAYAIAKIAGIKMCQSYKNQYGFNAISLMPTNLYGPNDNFDLDNSHVLPALIRKFHDAKIKHKGFVECWGDGSAMREFLHVDDLADACLTCMQKYDSRDIINIGTGKDVTIKELTEIVREIVGYNGEIKWDRSKPNGTPRKVLNIDKVKSLGWEPKYTLEAGIKNTYKWYLGDKN